jgi:hypothetical protein
MSRLLMRWFIVVDGAKKRKGFARPGTQSATRTDTNLLGVDGDAAKDIVHLATRFVLEAEMEDRVGIPEEIHCSFAHRI